MAARRLRQPPQRPPARPDATHGQSGLPTGGASASRLRHRYLLLYVGHARRAAEDLRRDGRQLAEERRDHARADGGRAIQRRRRVAIRGQLVQRQRLRALPPPANPRDGESVGRLVGRQHSRRGAWRDGRLANAGFAQRRAAGLALSAAPGRDARRAESGRRFLCD